VGGWGVGRTRASRLTASLMASSRRLRLGGGGGGRSQGGGEPGWGCRRLFRRCRRRARGRASGEGEGEKAEGGQGRREAGDMRAEKEGETGRQVRRSNGGVPISVRGEGTCLSVSEERDVPCLRGEGTWECVRRAETCLISCTVRPRLTRIAVHLPCTCAEFLCTAPRTHLPSPHTFAPTHSYPTPPLFSLSLTRSLSHAYALNLLFLQHTPIYLRRIIGPQIRATRARAYTHTHTHTHTHTPLLPLHLRRSVRQPLPHPSPTTTPARV
jgi:hypothetical protein